MMQRFFDLMFWAMGKVCIAAGFFITIFGMCAIDTENVELWFFPSVIVGGIILMGIGHLIGKRYVR